MLLLDSVAKTLFDTKTIEASEGDAASQIYVGFSR